MLGGPTVLAERRIDAFRINFLWLTRLRWGAVVGQSVVVAVVHGLLRLELPLAGISTVILLEVALNVWAREHVRRGRAVGKEHVALLAALDLLLFSALLYFSGGPENPFSSLYLIHIALSSLVLPTRESAALVLLALACSAALFFFHVPLPSSPGHHDHHLHLQGMWVAFGVAASFIVYLLQRVLREFAEVERQLQASRELTARRERLASLATLSAGAAHELATPLGTIAVASGELLRALGTAPENEAAREDVRLIRDQVERCRRILEGLSADAGQAHGASFGAFSARELVDEATRGLPQERLTQELSVPDAALVRGPRTALAQALRALVTNALDASDAHAPVALRVRQETAELVLEVEDEGSGMGDELRRRATEPFFTTKPAGRGLGLGLFLAQSVADQLGGTLTIDSQPGSGTRVALRIPSAATTRRMADPSLGPHAGARPHAV